ncbi:MAG: protein kinase domain-containing protein [Planctomycetota bacterium]|jgi:serine/threonine protein kinase/predicted Zn-dependent protease
MANEERAASIIAEWFEERGRGSEDEPEDLIRSHPDLAEELRSQFAVLGLIDRAFPHAESVPKGVPELIADYRLVREIGRGGMGVVYEAEQVSLRRKVALKLLSPAITSAPQAVRRFQREAQAASRLHHTNIVPIYAMGQHAGLWYYAMEFVDGCPLHRVLEKLKEHEKRPTEEDLARLAVEGNRPESETASQPLGTGTGDRSYYTRAAEMFAGVADALHLAHLERVVHRDVKPSNLLLDGDGVLKIVDFGLARYETDGPSLTITGDLLGTPAYMSPEQAMAKRMDIDHRTDIYSLGATLYEVLTLRAPFQGKTLQEMCSQVITKDPVRPRRRNLRVPRDLETIALKAMEKDRDKRFQSAAEFARDLRRFAEGSPIQARRVGPVGRAWRKVQRNRIRAGLTAAAALLVLGAIVIGVRAQREAQRRRSLEYDRLLTRAEMRLARPGASLLDSESAAELCEQAIALIADRPEAYWLRSFAPGRTLEQRLEDIRAAEAQGLATGVACLARAHLFALTGDKARSEREEAQALLYKAGDPAAAYFKGRLLAARGQSEEALSELSHAVDHAAAGSPIRHRALRHRSRLREQEGDASGALRDLHMVMAMREPSTEDRIRALSLWLQLDQPSAADAAFEQVFAGAREQNTRSAWSELTDALRQLLAPEAALLRIRKVLDEDPENAYVHGHCGAVLYALGRHEEALVAFERACDLEPAVRQHHAARAVGLNCLSRYDEALEAAEHALDLSRDAHTLALKGAILNNLLRHEEALIVLDQANTLDPNDPEAHAWRAAALAGLDRNAEALDETLVALNLDPYSAEAHSAHAHALRMVGRLDDALEGVDRALELRPNKSNAHLSRGNVLDMLQRYEEALAAYDRAIELDPDSFHVHCERGRLLLYRLGQPAEALVALDVALEKGHPGGRVWVLRGVALERLGKWEQSLAARRKALEFDSTVHHNAHYGCAKVLYRLQRFEEALEACESAIDAAPSCGAYHNVRGAILQDGLKRHADALTAFDEAIRLGPNEAAGHANRGRALMSLGQPEEALESFLHAVELYGDERSSISLSIAQAYGQLGNTQQGREWYDKAVAWMEEHKQNDEGLNRFRAEVEELLGITDGE